MNRTPKFLLAAALACSMSVGCVTTGAHEKAMADLKADDQKALDATKADLGGQLDACNAHGKELSAKLADAQGKADGLNKLLGNASADKDNLGRLLAASNSQLEELNKQKAAAEARAAVYKSLTDKLRSMIDSGKLSVKIRNGRMLISLPNDVLFESGSASLKKAGQDAIAQVASVLTTFNDRQFLVAGHTDDQAIHTAKFPSNWELSTARAVDVTRFLVAKGMNPKMLGAVGYGEFDPVIANDSVENRAQNRRIEIQLQPNLSDLPSLDGLATPATPPASK
jgi:chemotaxis protein MotB